MEMYGIVAMAARRWGGALQTCRQMHDEIQHEAYHNPRLLPESNWNLDQRDRRGNDEPLKRLDQSTLPSGLIGKLFFDFDHEWTDLAFPAMSEPHSLWGSGRTPVPNPSMRVPKRLKQLLRMEIDYLVVYIHEYGLRIGTKILLKQQIGQEVNCSEVEFRVRRFGHWPLRNTWMRYKWTLGALAVSFNLSRGLPTK